MGFFQADTLCIYYKTFQVSIFKHLASVRKRVICLYSLEYYNVFMVVNI